MPTPCRGCRQPVVFGQTEAGKKMPLDAEPNADGNVLEIGQTGSMLAIRVLTRTELSNPPAGRRFMPHFATCPAADEFRNRKQTGSKR